MSGRASTPPSRRTYTAEEKARAVKLFAEVGATAAARELGPPCTDRTVLRWAKAAGVSSPEERRRQTAEARAEVERKQAEAHATLAPALTRIAALSLGAQLELLDVVSAVLRQAREGGVVGADLTARLSAVQMTVGQLNPRALVALSTRAIHDLQLLTGGDTERSTGEIRVYLAQLAAGGDEEGEPTVVDLTLVQGGQAG
jgi:transposase-like protein